MKQASSSRAGRPAGTRVGYATAGSFTAAFHRLVGVTPRQYFPVS